jgi:hypothetical protein
MPRRNRKAGVCLCGGACGAPLKARGLSRSCYQAAKRDIARGRTTWKELEAAGLALPAIPPERSRRSPIGKKIDALVDARSG